MKLAALFLFLLLFRLSPVSQGQTEASAPQEDDVRTGVGDVRMGVDVSTEIPVLWDELLGLKELVLSLRSVAVLQRLELRSMESRLRDGELEAVEQRDEMERVEVKTEADGKLLMELNSDLRRKVDELEEQNKVRDVEFSSLQLRLNTSEGSVDDLKEKSSALVEEMPLLQTRLRASESTVEHLRRKVEELEEQNKVRVLEFSLLQCRLNTSDSSVDDLKEKHSDLRRKVEEQDEQNKVQAVKVSSLDFRLNTSESSVDDVKKKSSDLKTKVEEIEEQNKGRGSICCERNAL
ncbi:early endosome antigen 1-like [Eleginops maclovinus]|uniref:early endosome antigen 1-like n=1 Tax=Eleginops maclovinus TaxID=56733 RepID=UPI00308073BA